MPVTAHVQHARAPIDLRLLRVARVWGALTQRELARRIEISLWRYGRIESGISPMRETERGALLRELPLLARLERGADGC